MVSGSLGKTKSRAFAAKSGQNISSSVEVTKSRAFAAKSGQNCANLLSKQYVLDFAQELSDFPWYYWNHITYSCGNHTRFKTCYFKTTLKGKSKNYFWFWVKFWG